MNRKGLFVISAVLCLAPMVVGSSISINTPVYGTWEFGAKVSPNCIVEATFRLTNTSGFDIAGWSNGFKIYTAASPGGPATDHMLYLSADTLPIGWQVNYMDGSVFIYRSSDLIGEDTIGFGGFPFALPGFPNGFSEDVWYIRVAAKPSGTGHYLCIDTSFFPPAGAWLWSSDAMDVYPDWNGPMCWQIESCPCGVTQFRDTATVLRVPINGPYSHLFVAKNDISPYIHATQFKQLEGPGFIEPLDDSTCVWHYSPTPADLGRTYTLKLHAMDEAVCAFKTVTVTFCEPTLEFTGTVSRKTISVGGSVTVPLPIDCPGYPLFIKSDGGAPAGTSAIEGAALVFTAGPGVRGYYPVLVGTTDGSDSDFVTVPVLVTDPTCILRGNVDGRILPSPTINVSDLTYLVAFLFQGGPRPPNMVEGDVAGGGPISIVDLTYLVNHLFKGGPVPPPCD